LKLFCETHKCIVIAIGSASRRGPAGRRTVLLGAWVTPRDLRFKNNFCPKSCYIYSARSRRMYIVEFIASFSPPVLWPAPKWIQWLSRDLLWPLYMYIYMCVCVCVCVYIQGAMGGRKNSLPETSSFPERRKK